jgi:hypothetical protein
MTSHPVISLRLESDPLGSHHPDNLSILTGLWATQSMLHSPKRTGEGERKVVTLPFADVANCSGWKTTE